MSIRYFRSMPRPSRESLQGRVLREIKREFGAQVEPFTLHLPVPELLAGAWMACRETLLAGKGRRDGREMVAAAVSSVNGCPYCVDAHAMMLMGTSGNQRNRDPYLSAVAAWAAATRDPLAPLLATPPFKPDEAPAFIGTGVFFHYINRMVTILLGSSPLPLKAGFGKTVSMRLGAWYFMPAIRLEKIPGTSLGLLPAAELPDDLSWAESSAETAGAFARFAGAIETAGSAAVPESIRNITGEMVMNWNGGDPDISGRWCDNALARLESSEKSAGRLALLAALAPYRITEEHVREYSASFPGDGRLLGLLAWSSFTAARRIGSWLR